MRIEKFRECEYVFMLRVSVFRNVCTLALSLNLHVLGGRDLKKSKNRVKK